VPCGNSKTFGLNVSNTFWRTCATIEPGKSLLMPVIITAGMMLPAAISWRAAAGRSISGR